MNSIDLKINSRDVWMDDAHVAKLDRIVIDLDAIVRLTEWRDAHKELVRHSRPVLTEGIIVHKAENGGEVWQYFKSPSEEEDGLQIIMVNPASSKRFPILTVGFQTDVDDFGHTRVLGEWTSDDFADRVKGKSKELAIQDTITVYCSLMAYMMHYKEVRERIQKETVSTTRTKKAKHGKQGKRTVRASRVEYRLSFSSDTSEAREFQRHAESWGVRGHSRTYKKSGKTTWVRPHVKGTGKIDPKTYKV